MEYDIKIKRDKKSGKAKEKYERTGGFSQKHARLVEALSEKTASKCQSKSQRKK